MLLFHCFHVVYYHNIMSQKLLINQKIRFIISYCTVPHFTNVLVNARKFLLLLTTKSTTYVHTPGLCTHNGLTDIYHKFFRLLQVYMDTGR